MAINLQSGLIYWIIPAALALTALILLLWWIILLIPPQRVRSDNSRTPAPPSTPRVDTQQRPRHTTPAIDPDYHTQLDSNASIVVLAGLSDAGKIPLPGNQAGIGRFRDDSANIVIALDEKSVSRRHAQVRYDVSQRSYFLMDTNSAYGTYLVGNGQARQLAPQKEERIYNKDVVQFGQAVQVRFIVPGDERGTITVV